MPLRCLQRFPSARHFPFGPTHFPKNTQAVVTLTRLLPPRVASYVISSQRSGLKIELPYLLQKALRQYRDPGPTRKEKVCAAADNVDGRKTGQDRTLVFHPIRRIRGSFPVEFENGIHSKGSFLGRG